MQRLPVLNSILRSGFARNCDLGMRYWLETGVDLRRAILGIVVPFSDF